MRSNTSDLIVKRINNISSIQVPTEKKNADLMLLLQKSSMADPVLIGSLVLSMEIKPPTV